MRIDGAGLAVSASSRVLLLLPEAFSSAGGIQTYNRVAIRAFEDLAEGHALQVTALLLKDRQSDIGCEYLGRPHCALLAFAGSRPRFVWAALALAVRLQPQLVVFGHANFAPLALGVRAVCPPAKQWFVAHGWEVWRRLNVLHRWAFRQADSIFAVSEVTRRLLARHNGIAEERIALLPNALDPAWDAHVSSRAALPTDPARPVLLTVTRLVVGDKYKGVDQVLRALSIIARDVPGVRYVVVGDGSDRSRLEGLARDLGVACRVEFRGHLSTEELARAYAECSLFLMPSPKEGFGIVFIEAALFGKASIAARQGGSAEVVEDGVTGRLVDPDDVAAIAVAAIELLSHPDRLRALGERARRVAERFTYEAFRRRLEGYVLALTTPSVPGPGGTEGR